MTSPKSDFAVGQSARVRPILFSGPMVRAILEGRKTQTRRILKAAIGADYHTEKNGRHYFGFNELQDCGKCGMDYPVLRYGIGDILWVREGITASGALIQYLADHKTSYKIWPAEWKRDPRPSIHMPRSVSRLTLVVKDVRVQRLQDISEEDAAAEGALRMFKDEEGGFCECRSGTHYCGFAGLWSHINGVDSWDENPWVVAITFVPHRMNVDAYLAQRSAA
jgi:hypothetical protein